MKPPWGHGRPYLRVMDVRTEMLGFPGFRGPDRSFCPRASAGISAWTSAGYPAPKLTLWADFFVPEEWSENVKRCRRFELLWRFLFPLPFPASHLDLQRQHATTHFLPAVFLLIRAAMSSPSLPSPLPSPVPASASGPGLRCQTMEAFLCPV